VDVVDNGQTMVLAVSIDKSSHNFTMVSTSNDIFLTM
jgi:hypothetical protein